MIENLRAHMEPPDIARFSRFADLAGLEIMRARWVAHSFSPHLHESYTVGLNYAGRGAFECRGQLRDAAPGTCNLIFPGELHTGHATANQGWIYRNVYIEPQLMHAFLEGVECHRPGQAAFNSPLATDPVLATRLEHLFASMEERGSLLQRESLLFSVIARLVTDHLGHAWPLRNAGREHRAVRRVREYLHEHLEENVSIAQIASLAGLSPYYLIRTFRKEVGVPPHQYQTIVRVNRACALLRSGASLADTACQSGFYDQSHLNRCFRKMLGVPPGEYAHNS